MLLPPPKRAAITGGFSMKIATKRAVTAATALLLAAGTLTACASQEGSTDDTADGANGKIALLLPESKTTRYEAYDRPIFEAKVADLCPECEVIYSNADQDPAKQQQQAESALTQGIEIGRASCRERA